MKKSNVWITFVFSLLFSIVYIPLTGRAQQADLKDVLQKAAPAFPADENRAEVLNSLFANFTIDRPSSGEPPRPVAPNSTSARRAKALLNIMYTETFLGPHWKQAIILYARSNASQKGLALRKLYANIGKIAKYHVEARRKPEDDPVPKSAIRGREAVLTSAIIEAAEILIDDPEAHLLLETIAKDSFLEDLRKSAKEALEKKQ
jgi:hypothetical protein